jgi:hypothetical protein
MEEKKTGPLGLAASSGRVPAYLMQGPEFKLHYREK